MLLWFFAALVLGGPAAAEFYGFKSGRCQDEGGRPGLNPALIGVCSDFNQKVFAKQVFKRTDLRGSEFTRGIFDGTRFEGANAAHTQWREARIWHLRATGSIFDHANMRGVGGMGAHFHNCSLERVDARGAKLWHARFTGSNLRHADLRNAFLVLADFSGADLRGADLRNSIWLLTRFKGAKYDSATRLPFSEAQAAALGMVKSGP